MSSAIRYKKQQFKSNKEVAHLLRSIAAAYLIKNANRFRIIAYENAADTVERMTREIRDVWQDGDLDQIPGIGKILASSLDEFFRKGYSSHFQKALKDIPDTVFELMQVPSLGPKKAYKLVKTFHLTDKKTVFHDLKKLCIDNKIAEIPTFGKKSQETILKALDLYEKRKETPDRMPLPYAYTLANEIIEYLKRSKYTKRVDALGSLRRMVVTIGDIDIAIACQKKDITFLLSYFLKYQKKIAVDNAGEKKASIIVPPQIRVDLRLQDEKNYGPMLQYLTGSKSHNIKLREYALKKGYSLSEYGIKHLKSKKTYEFQTEENFYQFLGLQYIPPEIREGTNEIDLALKNKIPKLVEPNDVKGDLHLHSRYDLKPSHDLGVNSYKEIYTHAKELGYEYIGFSDHNPKITGLTKRKIVDIMKRRKEHIDNLFNTRGAIECFVGLEVDIQPNGEVALPPEACSFVDYLIVSVHSVFDMDTRSMTARVLKALEYPKVKILGHPTGRLLGKREGYELEWDKIFHTCKEKNICLEINAWPERLDLPDSLVREGIQAGVKFFINTDAHANWHMDNMFYGVSVARRGWATKHDIINTEGVESIANWLRR